MWYIATKILPIEKCLFGDATATLIPCKSPTTLSNEPVQKKRSAIVTRVMGVDICRFVAMWAQSVIFYCMSIIIIRGTISW